MPDSFGDREITWFFIFVMIIIAIFVLAIVGAIITGLYLAVENWG